MAAKIFLIAEGATAAAAILLLNLNKRFRGKMSASYTQGPGFKPNETTEPHRLFSGDFDRGVLCESKGSCLGFFRREFDFMKHFQGTTITSVAPFSGGRH